MEGRKLNEVENAKMGRKIMRVDDVSFMKNVSWKEINEG